MMITNCAKMRNFNCLTLIIGMIRLVARYDLDARARFGADIAAAALRLFDIRERLGIAGLDRWRVVPVAERLLGPDTGVFGGVHFQYSLEQCSLGRAVARWRQFHAPFEAFLPDQPVPHLRRLQRAPGVAEYDQRCA